MRRKRKVVLPKIRTMNAVEEPVTLWNAPFILILVFGFISGTANQMVNPQLVDYAQTLGASLTFGGTIFGLNIAMSLLLRPFTGVVNDMLNRKFVMIGSILTIALAFAGYTLFHSVAAIIVCRMLQGIGFAFMGVARTALAMGFMPKNRIGEGVGFTSVGLVLSQAIGPGIGTWMTDHWGYTICFLISLSLSLVGALVLSFLPNSKSAAKTIPLREKLHIRTMLAPEILPYAFLAGLFSIAIQIFNAYLRPFGADRGIENIALFFTMYAAIALVLRPLSGRILDRYGLPMLLYPAFIFTSLTYFLVGSAQGTGLILAGGVCRALGIGVALPSIHGMAVKRLGRERAGVASATIFFGQDIMNFLSPSLGGVLATHLGFSAMFYIFGTFVLIGIPLYTYLRKVEKRRELAAEAP